MKTIVQAIQVDCHGEIVTLPLQDNLVKERVKSPEELIEKWFPEGWFKNHFELVEIEVERPNDLMKCPNLQVICFKELMYPGWGTHFACWAAYEFGGCSASM